MKPFVEDRRKQPIPQDLIWDLIGVIRGQFCPDLTGMEFGQQKRFFVRVVTWPAAWLRKRDITLTPERYKEIFLEILDGVKVHGETQAVKFWPGYLLRVVQRHFSHHEDGIYAEGKSTQSAIDRVLKTAAAAAQNSGPKSDPIRTLAEAHKIVRPSRRRAASVQPPKQLSFL